MPFKPDSEEQPKLLRSLHNHIFVKGNSPEKTLENCVDVRNLYSVEMQKCCNASEPELFSVMRRHYPLRTACDIVHRGRSLTPESMQKRVTRFYAN